MATRLLDACKEGSGRRGREVKAATLSLAAGRAAAIAAGLGVALEGRHTVPGKKRVRYCLAPITEL